MIEKGKEYKIKGISQYFLRKYGTYNPIIRVEGTDKEIWPCSNWLIQAQDGNWAAKLFMERMLKERDQLPTYVDTIWYGHVHGKGECVLEEELEEVKKENKYLVLKIKDIENFLSLKEKDQLNQICYKIENERLAQKKKTNKYIVVNEDEPYAQKVWDLILGKQESDPYGLGFQNTEAHR